MEIDAVETDSTENNSIPDQEDYLQTQNVLHAASNHDLDTLRTLLRTNSASVQDPHTRITPLHAAIAGCKQNGTGESHNADNQDGDAVIQRAVKTMKLLLEEGAIWNDLDMNDETPGCLALRLGLDELYDIMVEAGLRAELLISQLETEFGDVFGQSPDEEKENVFQELENPEPDPVQSHNREAKPSSNGRDTNLDSSWALSNSAYLSSPLSIHPGRILDASRNGVMMSWETPLMQRTAELLAPRPGLRILNIGHGMGIIDTFFQNSSPAAHHIIEAHPSVLAHMRASPVWRSPTVTIHEGRWQEIAPVLIAQKKFFDVIYFDTFAEDYKALLAFARESAFHLLHAEGRWGFFNGLGADRQVCYDIYRLRAALDLSTIGFRTVYTTLQVREMGEKTGEWEGVRRKYWALSEYHLPVCKFLGE